MNISYVYNIALACTAVMTLYASDQRSSIVIANDRPVSSYTINMQEQELISGQKFVTLQDNAHRNHIPWIVCPIRLGYPPEPSVIKIVDVVELFKASDMHLRTDFSSLYAVDDAFFKALPLCLSKKCPDALPLYALGYHCIVPHQKEYTAYLCICFNRQGKQLLYSDISCALAMVFHNDYTQLLPLLGSLKKVPKDNPTRKFWNNVYQKLSVQQKKDLQQIFISQFSHDINI